jgi:hypothetical protein
MLFKIMQIGSNTLRHTSLPEVAGVGGSLLKFQ